MVYAYIPNCFLVSIVSYLIPPSVCVGCFHQKKLSGVAIRMNLLNGNNNNLTRHNHNHILKIHFFELERPWNIKICTNLICFCTISTLLQKRKSAGWRESRPERIRLNIDCRLEAWNFIWNHVLQCQISWGSLEFPLEGKNPSFTMRMPTRPLPLGN